MKSRIAALMGATMMTGACATRDAEIPDQHMIRELRFEVRAETIDEEARTVEVSFSSEAPYERWWGVEILDHGAKAVRLDRLNGSASVLMNHDPHDQVGVVEKAWVKGRKGRALLRFGKSPRAEEVFQDVKDGIRKLVSVAYRIIELVLESSKDGCDTYRVSEWEPYEISLVAIPADATIGVGRDSENPPFDPRTLVNSDEEDEDMYQRRDGSNADPSPVPAAPAAPAIAAPAAEDRAARETADRETRAAERQRCTNIRALAARFDCAELGETAITEERSIDEFVQSINERQPDAQAIRTAEDSAIGLGARELQRFSFVRLLCAIANPADRRAQEDAAFELECSAAAQRGKRGGEMRGFTVPVDVLRHGLTGDQRRALASPRGDGRRDLVAGTTTAGGHTVSTDLMADQFIDLLRNAMAIEGLGATMLTDLEGNLAIPRQTGGATAYWVAEGVAPTESQQAFDQVTLSPETVGAFTDISRRLLLQSSIDVENFVRRDLATVIALELDRVAVNGSGASNQPEGILNTSGIGAVVGGTDGAAPDWNDIIQLETEVAVDNADIGNLAYLTNAKVRGKLKRTEKFSGTNGDPIWERDGSLNGYTAAVSNQVPGNLTKGTSSGVCSAILFGNWRDLIVGMWSGLDLMADPYTSSTTGTVRIVALQDADVAVRHAESFAAMKDALTV